MKRMDFKINNISLRKFQSHYQNDLINYEW